MAGRRRRRSTAGGHGSHPSLPRRVPSVRSDAEVCRVPHPVRSRRLRSVLTGGAVPLLLLTGLPAQAHAQEAAVHTVRPGDTLTRISAARGVSVADLLRFNGLGLETVLLSLIHI